HSAANTATLAAFLSPPSLPPEQSYTTRFQARRQKATSPAAATAARRRNPSCCFLPAPSRLPFSTCHLETREEEEKRKEVALHGVVDGILHPIDVFLRVVVSLSRPSLAGGICPSRRSFSPPSARGTAVPGNFCSSIFPLFAVCLVVLSEPLKFANGAPSALRIPILNDQTLLTSRQLEGADSGGDTKLRIFSGTANPALSQEIACYLGLNLGQIKIKRFADGEIYVQLQESVRGCDVFLVQPTCPPANENLMELLVMIDACRRASAKNITAVIPYFGYARADRKTQGRESIAAKLVANLITEAGANRVLACDLHSGQSMGYFDIPVDHVYGQPVILDYLASKTICSEELVVVSPDVGGVARARAFAKKLSDAPLAIVDKRRHGHNVAEVMNLIGDVRGKVAVMVDDMIDTAGTIAKGAALLHEEGAREVYACSTHAVFRSSEDKRKGQRTSRGEKLQESSDSGMRRGSATGREEPREFRSFADMVKGPVKPSVVARSSRMVLEVGDLPTKPTPDDLEVQDQSALVLLQQVDGADKTLRDRSIQGLASCGGKTLCYGHPSEEVETDDFYLEELGPPAIERLSSGLFQEVIITNTIPVSEKNYFPQLTVLSVANLLGETIWRVHDDCSVSSFYQMMMTLKAVHSLILT
ncbi:hypothetical protein Taro_006566, partial [Colocasia esculenta]|nr:hypothetical protein [Colocasia esculenta]